MQVQQIIRASADVLTITRLAPGNVYKRVDETSYNGTPTIRFGVVQDVMNNGSDAAVTALEYQADYSGGAKATLQVLTGTKAVAIFPALPEEVTVHLAELRTSAVQAVQRAEAELQKVRDALTAVERISETIGDLTAPDTAAAVLDAAPVDQD